jgi:hypothetical protein
MIALQILHERRPHVTGLAILQQHEAEPEPTRV